jgi:hypothetical protein
MPTLTFEKGNIPTREEMHRLIEEMRQHANPVDDLLELARTLNGFEQKYHLTSVDFFEKYQRGEMGDDMDFIRWAGRYQMYVDLKHKIELSLERVIS